MSLEKQIMDEMKTAMKERNEAVLRALRAIKDEILRAKSEPGANGEIDEATEQKFLQKMMKQRKDSLEIFTKENREDLAIKEREEIAVIERFLPPQMSEEAIMKVLTEIIANAGAVSPADMGKLMGTASKQMAGKADGKTISRLLKQLLN